jgi:hypothetical protein
MPDILAAVVAGVAGPGLWVSSAAAGDRGYKSPTIFRR